MRENYDLVELYMLFLSMIPNSPLAEIALQIADETEVGEIDM